MTESIVDLPSLATYCLEVSNSKRKECEHCANKVEEAVEHLTHELRRVREVLAKLVEKKPSSRVSLGVEFGVSQLKERNKMPVKQTITNEQKIDFTLSPKSDAGKPAKLDGKPSYSILSGNSTIEVAEDGLSGVLTSSDDPGDTQILVKADADLGEGVEEISDIITLSVVAATAKNLGLSLGTPVPK